MFHPMLNFRGLSMASTECGKGRPASMQAITHIWKRTRIIRIFLLKILWLACIRKQVLSTRRLVANFWQQLIPICLYGISLSCKTWGFAHHIPKKTGFRKQYSCTRRFAIGIKPTKRSKSLPCSISSFPAQILRMSKKLTSFCGQHDNMLCNRFKKQVYLFL